MRGAVVGLFVWVLGLSSSAVMAQQVTLAVQHYKSASSTVHQKVLQPWCERLGRATGGKLSCRIAPASQAAVIPEEMAEAVQTGAVDVAWTAIAFTPGRFPAADAFELPFATTSPEATARALWSLSRDAGARDFKDVRLLAIHTLGPEVIHNGRRPVKSLGDLKALRVRAHTLSGRNALNALGAMSAAMPDRQMASAMSIGMLDGAFLTWDAAREAGILASTSNHTEMPAGEPALHASVHVLLMNRAVYDRLPAPLRQSLDAQSGLDLSVAAAQAFAEADGPARKTVAVTRIQTVAKSDAAAMRKVSRPVVDAWVRAASGVGIDTRAVLADVQRLAGRDVR